MDTIDLTKLAHELRAVPEGKEKTEKMEINDYLQEHLLPIFKANRYPGLNELDFDQFEADDLCDLAGYLQNFGRVEFNLTTLNTPICQAPPKAATKRAFL